ncbi:phosphoglycerate mutase-like protein [Fomitiporia mediterranea MF3/22]|uniref:phosphoglycerate mutase-like protein n=1 Tax=Fomitiporia mediterranea (strain MF3/22) TaxID=694068 RepID=UPI0004408FCE|nr:phosphoglycerate mutase-like protein [Fomitiporia mediterranea MF3/22]EJD03940.1 phosphoglycerate mutase-like protein [Fomitiporia mediterranea MF3/22]
MIETIYIARHGYRMNWVTSSWKSVTGLAKDPSLAAFGEAQAIELSNYFTALPPEERPTAIFSSPYYRCLQTAIPVSESLQVPIYVEHGLSEWYSPAMPGTGLHPRPFAARKLKSYIPQIDPSWPSVWYPSRRGELVEEVHDRMGDCLEVLHAAIEQQFPEQHKRILLVSHAATVIAATRELVGSRDLPLRIGCCSITILQRKKGQTDVRGAYDAVKLGSGEHLEQGASRDWGFEDIVIKDGKVVDDVGTPGTEHEEDYPIGCQVSEFELTARM